MWILRNKRPNCAREENLRRKTHRAGATDLGSRLEKRRFEIDLPKHIQCAPMFALVNHHSYINIYQHDTNINPIKHPMTIFVGIAIGLPSDAPEDVLPGLWSPSPRVLPPFWRRHRVARWRSGGNLGYLRNPPQWTVFGLKIMKNYEFSINMEYNIYIYISYIEREVLVAKWYLAWWPVVWCIQCDHLPCGTVQHPGSFD